MPPRPRPPLRRARHWVGCGWLPYGYISILVLGFRIKDIVDMCERCMVLVPWLIFYVVLYLCNHRIDAERKFILLNWSNLVLSSSWPDWWSKRYLMITYFINWTASQYNVNVYWMTHVSNNLSLHVYIYIYIYCFSRPRSHTSLATYAKNPA